MKSAIRNSQSPIDPTSRLTPTALRLIPHSALRIPHSNSIRNPSPWFAIAIVAALVGCGDGKATDAELEAVRALQQSGARLSGNKEGRVVRLDLSGAEVSEEQLANAGQCERLETLVMQAATFDEAGLVHLQGLKRIGQISLKETGVTDAGLAHLSQLKSLREIDLEETKITDEGLEHLAGLKNLEKLYLVGTSTTPTGVAKLKASLPNLKVLGR